MNFRAKIRIERFDIGILIFAPILGTEKILIFSTHCDVVSDPKQNCFLEKTEGKKRTKRKVHRIDDGKVVYPRIV